MNKTSLILITCVSLLFSIGLLMVFNTTSAEVLDRSLDISPHQGFLKQLFYAGIGTLLGLTAYLWNFKRMMKASPLLFWGCCLALALVIIPGVGTEINGAKRWLSLGQFSFQPSEFAKYIIPFYAIYWISTQKKEMNLWRFLQLISQLAVPILLIFLEPDNGTVLIVVATLVILFWLTKIPYHYWAIPLLSISLVGGVVAYNMSYVRARIRVYLHPELDLKGKGHQPHQSKIAAGSGGAFGRGLGESLQKLNYLPEARSDYIGAIFAEEFGFVGIMALICVYMAFATAGFFIAAFCADTRGFYFATVITFLIVFQAFLNLGVVSGLLPSKGTTLPFFSQGGSSLIANIAAIFVLLNIANKKERKEALHAK